ncbi:hypothetical protein L1987_62001 [Smallanthus sonchifolius]|uniref:Uncharacterized protein n=1 Tax=Smallanthus sonchifolius TaxID=185202 RepID=A0ACB9C974_9ASTR|nr:hypothetical protein L1987_62001 [Smallanthus sonchifolius]
MARMTVIEALILKEAWGVSLNRTSVSLFQSSRCADRIVMNVRDFCSGRRIDHQINCSRDKNLSSSPSLVTENMQDRLRKLIYRRSQINTYPSARRFTAIGMGGDDFVRFMVVAVESVIQHPVPQGYMKVSSGGKYVSVNIGPVLVVSREQVQAVYNAMRSDERVKFFL